MKPEQETLHCTFLKQNLITVTFAHDSHHLTPALAILSLLNKKHGPMYHELNSEQADSLLLGQVIGRLACTDGKKPYIFPVTYCYDGDYIYGHTNDGTKLQVLRQNPNVCFEVDSALDMNHWRSVVITGKFEELSETEIVAAREILFNRVFQLMTDNRVHAHEHVVTSKINEGNALKDIIYRIKISDISGRMLSLSDP